MAKKLIEMIAVMQHFENGGRVSVYSEAEEKHIEITTPIWDWPQTDYSIFHPDNPLDSSDFEKLFDSIIRKKETPSVLRKITTVRDDGVSYFLTNVISYDYLFTHYEIYNKKTGIWDSMSKK